MRWRWGQRQRRKQVPALREKLWYRRVGPHSIPQRRVGAGPAMRRAFAPRPPARQGQLSCIGRESSGQVGHIRVSKRPAMVGPRRFGVQWRRGQRQRRKQNGGAEVETTVSRGSAHTRYLSNALGRLTPASVFAIWLYGPRHLAHRRSALERRKLGVPNLKRGGASVGTGFPAQASRKRRCEDGYAKRIDESFTVCQPGSPDWEGAFLRAPTASRDCEIGSDLCRSF